MNLPSYFFRGLTVLIAGASLYVLSQLATIKKEMRNEMSLHDTFNRSLKWQRLKNSSGFRCP